MQARGLFGHVTSAVQVCRGCHMKRKWALTGWSIQNTFTQLTQTIEEKTASPSHPGVITQVTNAVQQGAARVDAFIDQVSRERLLASQGG